MKVMLIGIAMLLSGSVMAGEHPKNSISFTFGINKTDLTTYTHNGDKYYRVSHEEDFGIMYQRDVLPNIRFSTHATLKKTLMFGLGFNW